MAGSKTLQRTPGLDGNNVDEGSDVVHDGSLIGSNMPFNRNITSENRNRAAPAHSCGRRGAPATGRIVKLLVGNGHGFIRLSDEREVYFHRADLEEGTSINNLAIGDTVAFEHFDDTVSGARALCVRRSPVPVATCAATKNQDNQDESGSRHDGRGGFDRDQPSEVAGQPIHQGGQRKGEHRNLEYKHRERDVIPPEPRSTT